MNSPVGRTDEEQGFFLRGVERDLEEVDLVEIMKMSYFT
jgi:hypothetical protein